MINLYFVDTNMYMQAIASCVYRQFKYGGTFKWYGSICPIF